MKIFFPLARSQAAMILEVVVFPFVPVTQIIVMSREGNQYTTLAVIALSKWYQRRNGLSRDTRDFIFCNIVQKLLYIDAVYDKNSMIQACIYLTSK
jgi:hypothetical protein